MILLSLRFYAELNDFLPSERRQATLDCALKERGSVKDVIEAQGVPHTEVDLILANGESVGFGYQVQDGDRIAVYPAFRSLDVGPESRVRPVPLAEPRFVLDQHLGKLAAGLRLLGFDTLYRNDYHDDELAQISAGEQRILLTRDRGLLKRGRVTYGYYVWATDPERQIEEVVRRFRLGKKVAPFQRCLRCNGLLTPVEKAAVQDQLEPMTDRVFHEFAACQACGQVYWKGSHYERMQRLVARVIAQRSIP